MNRIEIDEQVIIDYYNESLHVFDKYYLVKIKEILRNDDILIRVNFIMEDDYEHEVILFHDTLDPLFINNDRSKKLKWILNSDNQ